MESDGRPQKKPTSPWLYVGCGCGAIVILGMLGIAGMAWWGVRTAKSFAETLEDPEKRAAKVREVLPYETLPAGYYPGFAMTAPFNFMEMAILTDHEPTSQAEASREMTTGGDGTVHYDPDFEERGFVYINMRDFQGNQEKMRRFLRGEAPLPDERPWMQSNVEFNPEDVIRRGEVSAGGRQTLYTAFRGEISRQGRNAEGIVTMVMPECQDKRFRFGLWFGPDPAPDQSVKEADFTGTAADPAKVQEFLGHFGLCGART